MAKKRQSVSQSLMAYGKAKGQRGICSKAIQAQKYHHTADLHLQTGAAHVQSFGLSACERETSKGPSGIAKGQ